VNLLGGAILFFAYKMMDYKTKEKNIGEVLLELPKGLHYSDMAYQTLWAVITLVLVILIYALELITMALGYIFFFLAGIIIAYFFFYLYLTTQEKGFFENAILTAMGVLPYQLILGYELKEKRGSSDTVLHLKTRGRFIKVTHLLVVPKEAMSKAIAMLDKRMPKAVGPK
jgi:hypothetical protein